MLSTTTVKQEVSETRQCCIPCPINLHKVFLFFKFQYPYTQEGIRHGVMSGTAHDVSDHVSLCLQIYLCTVHQL